MAAGSTPSERARALAASTFDDMCGAASPRAARSATVVSSSADCAALLEEGAVDEDAVDDPEIARAGHAEVESDRARALDDLGVLHHRSGWRHRPCCRRTRRGCSVDDGLRVAVGLEGAVPSRWSSARLRHTLACGRAGPRRRRARGTRAGGWRARRRARRNLPGRGRRRARGRRCCRTAPRAARRRPSSRRRAAWWWSCRSCP